MSKIFIFAFDDYYPQGGMNDLVRVLDEEGSECIGSDFLIQPELLAKCVENAGRDQVQVLHFDAHGAPLLLEKWQRLTVQEARVCAASLQKLTTLGTDSRLGLVEVQQDFPSPSRG